MSSLRPSDIRPPPTADDDPRVGHFLLRPSSSSDPPRAVLIGFPTDVGVRRNGGRPGAASGPRAIREVLYRMTPGGRSSDVPLQGPGSAPEGSSEEPAGELRALGALLTRTSDLGDVITSSDLAGDQRALGEAIAPHLERGAFVIILGGGHETAFGHFLGYASAGRKVRILNWDAHADVRALVDGEGHSGSPFRQAIEHQSGGCVDYTVAGLQPHVVARSHAAWVTARGGRCIWRPALDTARIAAVSGEPGARMVSFDLDAVDQAFAPGVSAPSTGGLTVAEWLEAARLAGRNPDVGSCDIVELNPTLDRDGQTARLAALTVWTILSGAAERGAASRLCTTLAVPEEWVICDRIHHQSNRAEHRSLAALGSASHAPGAEVATRYTSLTRLTSWCELTRQGRYT